jgi:transcription antitermination protein NusB
MGKRRKSREVAFQLLYAVELSGESPYAVQSRYASFNQQMEDGVWDFATTLFTSTIENLEKIDSQLSTVMANWSMERVSKIEKSILRLGCAEALLQQSPFNVIVDEMIEISKQFGDKDSSSFINGVLDAWKKKYC